MFDCFVRPLSKLCGLAVFTLSLIHISPGYAHKSVFDSILLFDANLFSSRRGCQENAPIDGFACLFIFNRDSDRRRTRIDLDNNLG